MMAITIWPLFATLIMAGAKPAELRSWKPWTKLIGQRVAIHAGARKMRVPEIEAVIADPRKFCSELADDRMLSEARDIAQRALHHPETLVCGAVLGTAVIGDPVPDVHWGWAWPLSGIEAFAEPVPASGKQGFWVWPN